MSSTQLYQLLKFPQLVMHLIEHKNQNKDLNVYCFLFMHYMHEIAADNDSEKDMKLPFKVDEKDITADISIIQHYNYCELLTNPFCANATTFIFKDELFIPSSFMSNIWQPPRNC